jgi:predicted outer membrane repeat protein
MSFRRVLSVVVEQRGTALPLAMVTLVILSALIIGFSVLGSSEPTIANNQLRVAQARAAAEAGVERAVWALNRGLALPPNDTDGIPSPLVGTALAPYNGSQLLTLATGGNTIGGFRVTVVAGATAYERNITSVGWVPNDTTTGPKTRQKITVTVFNPLFVMRDPPAALTVRGELQVGGNSFVDSTQDVSCGQKFGTLTSGQTSPGGSSDMRGAGDTRDNFLFDAHNGALPTTANDMVENVIPSAFDPYMLTNADIDTLRAFAKARGTYLQGSQTFNSSNQLPPGLVFVDTVSGTDITAEGVTPATLSSDFASVSIHGNAGSGAGGAFNGWLFVNGGLSVDGNFLMNGFVYAQNDISYHGTGTGQVNGAMVSRNIRDTSSTSIDSDLLGNATIVYDCNKAKTSGGAISAKWLIKGGTYKEVSGSS